VKKPFITTDRFLGFMLVCFVGNVVATYLTRPEEHTMTAKRFEYGTVTKIHSRHREALVSLRAGDNTRPLSFNAGQ